MGFWSSSSRLTGINKIEEKKKKVLEPDGSFTTDFQNWKIFFGNTEKAKVCKYVYHITKKWIWSSRDGHYLHNKLLQLVLPERNLFAADYYALEYRLNESPFVIRVNLDDPEQICRAFDDFTQNNNKTSSLSLVPKKSLSDKDPVFDKHPPKTVQSDTLKTRSALTRYIVDMYTMGNIDLKTFDQCLKMKLPQLKNAVYIMLPPREQAQHEYLRSSENNQSPLYSTRYKNKQSKKRLPTHQERSSTRASPEERFMAGLIDIDTYADLKDPSRKIRRQRAQASYPLSEKMQTCVICFKAASANIKCMECPSVACSDCIRSHFTENPQRAFVLMHHIYCFKAW